MNGVAPTFRLLDARVGWDPRPSDGLADVVVDEAGLRLAPLPPALGDAAPGARPALVRSADGSWWLGGKAGVLRLEVCDDAFRPWVEARRVRALAARGPRLAVLLGNGRGSGEGSGEVRVHDTRTGQLVGRARVRRAVALELEADGGLLVTDRHGLRTWLDPSGLVCRTETCRPGGPVPPRPAEHPLPAEVTTVVGGFCLTGRGCFDWRGHPMSGGGPGADGGPDIVARRGQYLTLALDSRVPACRWHRVRLDAEVPEGTTLEIAFATTDGPPDGRTSRSAISPAPNPPAPGEWEDFPGGDPHPTDWYTVVSSPTASTLDSTLGAPPGRYGYLRLRLTGDGRRTPVVHQVRLDLPRATGLSRLPAVFAEEPTAADFTERFLSIVDAELEEIDEVLARRAAMLDAEALPDDALGWLASLLGTGFEAEMDVAQRRELLRAAPQLYRQRGTLAGVLETLRVATGVTATIEELGTARPWGAVGMSRLGSLRLFGRSRVRVRLGTSQLGGSRLESAGNPDDDAIHHGASRVRVHVPPGTGTALRALVERVLRSQLPAHVVADVVVARPRLTATVMWLGVDTVLASPPELVVGSAALGGGAVVAGGRGAGADRVVGRPVALSGLGSD